MTKEIKFTEEEVQQINKLRQDVSAIFTQLGQLSIEKKRRIDELTEIEEQLLVQHKQLQEQEQTLFKGLNEKYGDGNYNPETNTFVPANLEEKDSE
jgi:phage host-nuclease inhibitor protein Gam